MPAKDPLRCEPRLLVRLNRRGRLTLRKLDLDDVTERLLSFHDRYNRTVQPFDWTFTRDDLNRLLTRLGRHDHHTPPPLAA